MSNDDSYPGRHEQGASGPQSQGGYGEYDQTQINHGQYGQQDYRQGAHAHYDQTQANSGQYGQQQYGQQRYGHDAPAAESTTGAGFFKALFDFSFSTFITPKVVKFVYVLSVVALGLLWFIMLVASFSQSAGAGLAVLIVGPILVLLYLVFIRMTLEFYLATVRMSEDIHHKLR